MKFSSNIVFPQLLLACHLIWTEAKLGRAEITEKFIHKLKCKYNKIKIESIDERLTTVQAHQTMRDLKIKAKNKKNIVDTISAEYILEAYLKREF